MSGSFSAPERLALQNALRAGQPLRCPACGAAIAQQPVPTPQGIPYVRHRVLLVCTGCGKGAAVDRG